MQDRLFLDQPIYSGSATKEIDRYAIEQGGFDDFELMSQAGERAYQCIAKIFPTASSMIVLCGGGNNGGDGYIVAAAALAASWRVHLIAASPAKTNSARKAAERFHKLGGRTLTNAESLDEDHYDVVVDALLGVGIRGAPNGKVSDLIKLANTLKAYKFSVDVPSGVCADTGQCHQPCFRADKTLTYIAHKIGLMTGPAKNMVGELRLETLGLPSSVKERFAPLATVLPKPDVTRRSSDSHKGLYGNVVICGGDTGMLGAVLLAGRAALRSGSGKVHVLSAKNHLDMPALSTPELMSTLFDDEGVDLCEKAHAIALGPGLGLADWGREVFERLIGLDVSKVIDADALTLLADSVQQLDPTNSVLTPHPGEAAKLLKCATAEIQKDRRLAALAIAKRYQAVCVLKGAGSLVASPDGRLWVSTVGNAGMATAGMGDVLTGMVAAYLGFGYSPLRAAKSAVFMHSYTADRCCQYQSQSSLIATDVIEALAKIQY